MTHRKALKYIDQQCRPRSDATEALNNRLSLNPKIQNGLAVIESNWVGYFMSRKGETDTLGNNSIYPII